METFLEQLRRKTGPPLTYKVKGRVSTLRLKKETPLNADGGPPSLHIIGKIHKVQLLISSVLCILLSLHRNKLINSNLLLWKCKETYDHGW